MPGGGSCHIKRHAATHRRKLNLAPGMAALSYRGRENSIGCASKPRLRSQSRRAKPVPPGQ